VEDLLDPTEVWWVLKNLFESHNVIQTLYLTNKLHSMRMEERTRVNDFMQTIKETTTNLASAGKIINETKMVHVVMNVFLRSYESFIELIIGEDELSGLEKLMGKFVLKEHRKEVCFGGLVKMKFCW
jgi:hypothetical protein